MTGAVFVCQACGSDLDPDTGLECQACGAWADPATFDAAREADLAALRRLRQIVSDHLDKTAYVLITDEAIDIRSGVATISLTYQVKPYEIIIKEIP